MSRDINPTSNKAKPSAANISKTLPFRRGQLVSAFALLEKKVNRIRGSSSEICEVIDLYATPDGDNTYSRYQHTENGLENINPSLSPTGGAEKDHIHHIAETQEIVSPSSEAPLTPASQNEFKIPLPDMGFRHFDTTPFTSPIDKVRSPSASSNYPSEGIRSEECLSPPNQAIPPCRGVTWDEAELRRFALGIRERTSE